MSIKQAIEALELAANRLDRVALDYDLESSRRYETVEWAGEARAALAALRSMPADPVGWLCETYENGKLRGRCIAMNPQVSTDSMKVTPLYATPHTEAVRMSDAEINHLVDTHVGGPTPSYPLGPEDWINFARAVEQATAARMGVKLGDV